jgi:hypothetical protein
VNGMKIKQDGVLAGIGQWRLHISGPL